MRSNRLLRLIGNSYLRGYQVSDGKEVYAIHYAPCASPYQQVIVCRLMASTADALYPTVLSMTYSTQVAVRRAMRRSWLLAFVSVYVEADDLSNPTDLLRNFGGELVGSGARMLESNHFSH